MIEKMAYDFAKKEVMPIIKEHDRNHTFPHELLPKMAELGFLGLCLPVRYGGAGFDYLSLGIVSEALEYADSSVRETMAVHLALHAMPIFQWGTEEQKRTFLPPLASGEHIGCFGLTEPGAGSDVAAMRTHGAQGRRRLHPERREDVDHPLQHRRPLPGLRQDQSGEGRRRDDRLHPRTRHEGADDRHHRGQDGRARQQHRLGQHARRARPSRHTAWARRARGSRSP